MTEEDGSRMELYACGMNNFFQLGHQAVNGCDSHEEDEWVPSASSSAVTSPRRLSFEGVIQSSDGVVEDVSCGATFTVALTSSGTPYQWGTLNGRVYQVPKRISMGIPLRCTQIACGRKHTLALMEGGFVMSWGVGYFGQLGHGDDQSYDRPRMIHQLDPQRIGDQVVSIAAGGFHSAVCTAGQLLFCFGFNRYGQCGQGTCSNKLSAPRPVSMSIIGSSSVRQLLCGRHHTCILTDKGSVYTWGASSFGRLGLSDPNKKTVSSPTEVPFFRDTPVHSMACGDFHMLALGSDRTVYSWGYGAEGQCGLGTTLHLRTPRPVEALRGIPVGQVACGSWWSMAVTTEGRLYCWGYGDGGWLGLIRPSKLPYVEPGPPTDKYGSSCAFDSDLNALLPEMVRVGLDDVKVEKVMGGGAHTMILGRRGLRRKRECQEDGQCAARRDTKESDDRAPCVRADDEDAQLVDDVRRDLHRRACGRESDGYG